jgi:YgiT-type zinc finger domain-containing protein
MTTSASVAPPYLPSSLAAEPLPRPATTEFGSCPCGSGNFERRWVEVTMKVGSANVRLETVPQAACPACGSRVYKAEQLERLEEILRGEAVDRRMNQR